MTWTRTSWVHPDRLPEGLGYLSMPILCSDPRTGDLRCFATARDRSNRSHPVTARAVLGETGRLRLIDRWEAIAAPGPPGAFDEAGLSLSHVRVTNDGYECMTFGWRLRNGGGWFNEIGSLFLDVYGQVLERPPIPTMHRSSLDLISMAYPFRAEDGTILYCGPSLLDEETGRPKDFRILQAKGTHDDMHHVVMDPSTFDLPGIHAFTRPWRTFVAGRHFLWFCMRGEKYQIARASEAEVNGQAQRLSVVQDFFAADNDEEDGNACYPSVLQRDATLVMLYNGAGFGKTGFGVAIQSISDLE